MWYFSIYRLLSFFKNKILCLVFCKLWVVQMLHNIWYRKTLEDKKERTSTYRNNDPSLLKRFYEIFH
jgi:tellurite resistance protein TehA-like permease